MRQFDQNQEWILQIYVSSNGKSPFEEWLQSLKDKTSKAKIYQRIDRIRLGNFGDCKSVGAGVYELRIRWGPGLRIYYGLAGTHIILLLCGGDKGSQRKDIRRAHQIWKEFHDNAS